MGAVRGRLRPRQIWAFLSSFGSRPLRIRRRDQARKGLGMPKRRSDGLGGGRKPRRSMRRQLFLVLDDWSSGYAIRKIDLPVNGCCAGLQPLPRPMIRLEAPRGLPRHFAVALGSKILSMHPIPGTLLDVARCFDVRSKALISGPAPLPHNVPWSYTVHGVPESPVFIPVGVWLCALWGRSFQLLEPQESQDLWSWRKLHDLSFDSSSVTSYAVHPDGQTIFVSVGGPDPIPGTTFCFVVDQRKDCVLKGTFDWTLPFQGCCYFVSELDAWVGLSRCFNTIGRLCACSVVNPDDSKSSNSLSYKFSKETVFGINPAEAHAGANLVYMGSKSEFCLLECICVSPSYLCEGPYKPKPYSLMFQWKEHQQPDHSLLRLTTFSLKFDESGGLTTGNTCRLHYYSLPGSVTSSSLEYPVSFCL